MCVRVNRRETKWKGMIAEGPREMSFRQMYEDAKVLMQDWWEASGSEVK